MARLDDTLSIARSYIGDNYEKFCEAFNPGGFSFDWAPAFISYVCEEAKVNAPWDSSYYGHINWWKSNVDPWNREGLWHDGTEDISIGDVAYYGTDNNKTHAGFISGQDMGTGLIRVIEGDSGTAASRESTVKETFVEISKIVGYAKLTYNDMDFIASSNSNNTLNTSDDDVAEIDLTDYIDALTTEINAALAVKTDRMKDLEYVSRYHGAPFRFLESTDPPVTIYDDDDHPILTEGRTFLKNIASEAPLVHFIPGLPSYLSNMSKSNMDIFKNYITDRQSGNEVSTDVLDKIMNTEGRYFNFVPSFAVYQRYLNLLCRNCAVYMGIGDKLVPGTNKTYKHYNYGNWQDKGDSADEEDSLYNIDKEYTADTAFDTALTTVRKIVDKVIKSDEVQNLYKDIFGGSKSVKCYVDAGSSFSESVSNDISQSQIAGLFDTGESMSKELQFWTSGGVTTDLLGKLASNLANGVADLASAVMSILGVGGSNLVNMVNYAADIISGANIVFPQMWTDSKYSKSYRCSVNLVSPYGDSESIFLNIIMPLMSIVALGLPRQVSANSFTSPMYVRVVAKGIFSSDMAIINSISIDKGGNGAWTASGLPLTVKVDIDITDLYTALSMPNTSQPGLYFNNDSLIEFLTTTCGVDTTIPNLALKIDTFLNSVANIVTDVPGTFYEKVVNKMNNWVMRRSGLFRN